MLNSQSRDFDFWRTKVLGYLTRLLSTGNYTSLQQSRHVEFFSEWIVPFLGPAPLSTNGKLSPIFKSFMCDDHTPLEFSLTWKPDTNKHLARFAIEPLPPNEQADPFAIVTYGLLVIDKLHRAIQCPGSTLAQYLVLEPSLFTRILKSISNYQATTIVSNIFLGFDLLPSQVQLKAYCILNIPQDFNQRLALISAAISPYTTATALSAFLTYFQSKPADWYSTYSPALFIIGIDCTGANDARIKLYFRYQVTVFDQLVDQISLGGRIPLSSEYISTLRKLWFRFIEEDHPQFLRSSDTSGVALYYEFNAVRSLPNVKCYVPVRLMVRSDQEAADITAGWLNNHPHFSKYTDSFLTTISQLWNDRELNQTTGTFTYIGLTSTSCIVGCYPTIYFSPTLFSLPLARDNPRKPSTSVYVPFARMLSEAGVTPRNLPEDCLSIAHAWFDAFSKQLINPCLEMEEIMTPNGFWRDLVAFSADIRTLHPRLSIQEFLTEHTLCMRPTNFNLLSAGGRTIANYLNVIQGTFTLQTRVGSCSGVFTLVPVDLYQWKALTIVIGLEGLHGSTSKFSDGMKISPSLLEYADIPRSPPQHPRAIVIGAGQAGLSVAARLENLGISTLVIERREHVGDGWRDRYDSLTLNTPSTFSHMPFVPFPSEWPLFPNSDVVADHIEAYPKVLGLHVLTSTVVVGTCYDDNSGTWTLQIRQGDDNMLTVQCSHLVLATGVDTLAGSEPKIPNIPKASHFKGETMHSTEFRNGKAWSGKRAVVIGAGCSGHDIAQELHRQGVSVTMVQRSSVAVVSRGMLISLFPDLYTGDNLPPTAVADRLFLCFPIGVSRSLQHEIKKNKASIDGDLMRNLRQKGFLLPDEKDSFFERLLIRRGGYYVDQGCSSLIINGEINLKAGIPIEAYTPYGLLFADGTEVHADLVVYATGFRKESLVDISSRLLNYQLVDKVNSIGGWDAEHEVAGVWRPTGHRRLWFAGGDFFACRFFSRLLAMQIKADEDDVWKPSITKPSSSN